MQLKINTLGAFDILLEDDSLMKESNRSYRLNKLFAYFITFRGRRLLPETIIDNLWTDIESNDPKNVLRTQIFRLRQVLKKIIPEYLEGAKIFNITFSNGYYSFELGEGVVLDIEEFEEYINLAEKNSSSNSYEVIELYKRALSLYKGAYMSENSYEVWLVPIRNHYRRLYLKAFFKLMELLKENDESSTIIELCEESILIEPFEEALHIYLIEAMLKSGQIKTAMSHYEYISSLISKELGVKSTPGLRNIYRKIQSYYEEKSEGDIKNIITKLEESTLDGALLCDSDYFRFLFNIEKRKCLRSNTNEYMSLITLKYKNGKEGISKESNKYSLTIARVLEKSLRKGDIFSFWNDTQLLVMLHEAKEEYLNKIEMRIRDNFSSNVKTDECKIDVEFFSITADENII